MKKDKSFDWHRVPANSLRLKGKRAIVIGGTGGLGRAISKVLAAQGAEVTVVGQTFRDQGVPNIKFIKADLSLMTEAAKVADQLPVETADLVLFTAGIFASPKRQETSERIERDLAVSYLNRLVIWRKIAPRLGTGRPAGSPKPRMFNMGYPGSGQKGDFSDLNAERSYSAMPAHMNTVAGNEMLVLEAVDRYPNVDVFGLNPGFVKTDIRSNFLEGNNVFFKALEKVLGWFITKPDEYAERITPVLFAKELNDHSGAMFDAKGNPILPTPSLDAGHVRSFIGASEALVSRTGVALT